MSQSTNSPSNKLGRRKFLIATSATVAAGCIAGTLVPGCGAAGAGGTGAGLGPQDTGRTVGDMAVGSFHAAQSYILARDAQGFYAYSSLCTHNGCTLPAPDASGESVCPCHRARFDANGMNVVGADGRGTLPNLEHYQVTFVGSGDAAQVQVNLDAVEPNAATRATPPSATPEAGVTA